MSSPTTYKSKKKAQDLLKKIVPKIQELRESNSFRLDSLNIGKISENIEEVSWAFANDLSLSFFSLKDLISNTDGSVTGSSKFLENYYPPFNATVYKILKEAGAINIVNSNLDEFGMGGTGLSSCYGIISNPLNSKYIIGGSSSGSAYLVTKELVDYSIVSDTGDSARLPASYCGIYGFKPSFGAISRYGFFPFCSQFDTPSILARSVTDVFNVFHELSKESDPRDLCTLGILGRKLKPSKDFSGPIKVAVLKNTFWRKKPGSKDSQEIQTQFDELLAGLKKNENFSVSTYEFPDQLLRLSSLVYAIVSWSESISNYSNLTGMLFPFDSNSSNLKNAIAGKQKGQNYSEILFNNRKVFGDEFTFRQMVGMYFLHDQNYEKVYIQAKKILSLINKEVDALFKKFDLVISPTTDDLPAEIKKHKRSYSPSNIKNILCLANFCSLPSISIPWIKVKGMPVGLHLMSKFGSDPFLFSAVSFMEGAIRALRN